jgi:hypothetical protein
VILSSFAILPHPLKDNATKQKTGRREGPPEPERVFLPSLPLVWLRDKVEKVTHGTKASYRNTRTDDGLVPWVRRAGSEG